MQKDDEFQTTLSKWPFILGDLLLVATALAIAILGNWQLTDWQVASCVIAVALGAALFVLPYVVEYRVRIQEESEDRSADLRVLEKHIMQAEQALDSFDTRLRGVEAAAANIAKLEDPSPIIEAIDERLVQVENTVQSHEARHEAQLESLKKEVEALGSREIPKAFDPKVLDPIWERLGALEARSSPAPEPSPEPRRKTKYDPAPEPEREPASDGEPKAPVEEPSRGNEPASEGHAETRDSQESSKLMPSRPKRAVRRRHKPEERRLLSRAINEKQDSSSTAVSRIIAAKSKTEPALDLDAEVPAMESSDMLFDDATVSSPVKKAKAKKSDTVFTASVFIGIGNKPYLRGSGAGLNWEKGVAMAFQEIGKWRWIGPPEMDEPVEVQVYRNDEEPDQSGKYLISPGEKVEISPVF